jgi:hypothetical protein
MQFRSPPPLPTILLIGRHLTKTRGGKRGKIASMIRFRAGILSGTSDSRIPRDVGVSIPQPSTRIYQRSQDLGISRGGKRHDPASNSSKEEIPYTFHLSLISLRERNNFCLISSASACDRKIESTRRVQLDVARANAASCSRQPRCLVRWG